MHVAVYTFHVAVLACVPWLSFNFMPSFATFDCTAASVVTCTVFGFMGQYIIPQFYGYGLKLKIKNGYGLCKK